VPQGCGNFWGSEELRERCLCHDLGARSEHATDAEGMTSPLDVAQDKMEKMEAKKAASEKAQQQEKLKKDHEEHRKEQEKNWLDDYLPC